MNTFEDEIEKNLSDFNQKKRFNRRCNHISMALNIVLAGIITIILGLEIKIYQLDASEIGIALSALIAINETLSNQLKFRDKSLQYLGTENRLKKLLLSYRRYKEKGVSDEKKEDKFYDDLQLVLDNQNNAWFALTTEEVNS